MTPGKRASPQSSVLGWGGLLHEGDGYSRGQKGCFRVSMKEGGGRMQLWRWGLAVGTG